MSKETDKKSGQQNPEQPYDVSSGSSETNPEILSPEVALEPVAGEVYQAREAGQVYGTRAAGQIYGTLTIATNLDAAPVPFEPPCGRLLFANIPLPPGTLPGHCTAAFLDSTALDSPA